MSRSAVSWLWLGPHAVAEDREEGMSSSAVSWLWLGPHAVAEDEWVVGGEERVVREERWWLAESRGVESRAAESRTVASLAVE